jgi:chromosome segregation ATPase
MKLWKKPLNLRDRIIDERLTALETEVSNLKGELQKMALSLTALQTAVAQETTVEQSAITLIKGLASQIQTLIDQSQNTVDPVALQTIVTNMTNSQLALAAAVAANTAPPVPNPPAAPAV